MMFYQSALRLALPSTVTGCGIAISAKHRAPQVRAHRVSPWRARWASLLGLSRISRTFLRLRGGVEREREEWGEEARREEDCPSSAFCHFNFLPGPCRKQDSERSGQKGNAGLGFPGTQTDGVSSSALKFVFQYLHFQASNLNSFGDLLHS